MPNHLETAYPRLASRLPRTQLADLPTPVSQTTLTTTRGRRPVSIKHDDVTGKLYGGNKVRKLEYLLRRAGDRRAKRIATFGTVASNHALATALYAKTLGFECTCFLSHQSRTPNAPRVLNMHLQNGTEIVRYPSRRSDRIRTLRELLWNRRSWLIPMGGSNWIGAAGFVNAGLELSDQIAAGKIDEPGCVYVANGTMATAAGLALGLALAGRASEVHAIRVTDTFIANPAAMQRLIAKTALLMNRFDPSIPPDLADRTRLHFRDDFAGDGYAKTNAAVDRAIAVARDDLGLELETTYTGKAMAAMLHDLDQNRCAGKPVLFWNSYNSRILPADTGKPGDNAPLPAEFLRYFD